MFQGVLPAPRYTYFGKKLLSIFSSFFRSSWSPKRHWRRVTTHYLLLEHSSCLRLLLNPNHRKKREGEKEKDWNGTARHIFHVPGAKSGWHWRALAFALSEIKRRKEREREKKKRFGNSPDALFPLGELSIALICNCEKGGGGGGGERTSGSPSPPTPPKKCRAMRLQESHFFFL